MKKRLIIVGVVLGVLAVIVIAWISSRPEPEPKPFIHFQF
jgi:hypothetical protein